MDVWFFAVRIYNNSNNGAWFISLNAASNVQEITEFNRNF